MSARDSLEFDPSDYERPRSSHQPEGIMRGNFELPNCNVSVLVTQNEEGEAVASAHVWAPNQLHCHRRFEVFTAPTRKEAWAALAQWVATAFAALLIFSGCGGPDVSCAGPLPVSCECATSCDFSPDAGVVVPDVSQVVAGRCLPRCWRRDTGEDYP